MVYHVPGVSEAYCKKTEDFDRYSCIDLPIYTISTALATVHLTNSS